MPIDFVKARELLERNASKFTDFATIRSREFDTLKAVMHGVFSMDHAALSSALSAVQASGVTVGAEPTSEYHRGLFIPFPLSFTSLQDAVKWAALALEGTITVSADGSQVYPSRDFSIPVGLVQVSSFVNEHAGGVYSKQLHLDLLPPSDLVYENEALGTIEFSDAPVNARRFELELAVLAASMRALAARDPRPARVVFLADNTLVLSFIVKLSDKLQEAHVGSLHACMDAARATGYPLIGYVDSSAAKDLVRMVEAVQPAGFAATRLVTDAAMLEHQHEQQRHRPMKPGDRTCAFICDRGDAIYQGRFKHRGHPVAFFYIKLNDQQLARAEFPAWCVEVPGMVDTIATVLLGESIAGAGYPYAVDQTHHACVIHAEDKEKFHRMVQGFAARHGLSFGIANKARSKRRRAG